MKFVIFIANFVVFGNFLTFLIKFVLLIVPFMWHICVMTLAERVTSEQLRALRNREITNRALARELGVTEHYLSKVFPGHKINKIPGKQATHKSEKKQLRSVRDEFRTILIKRVLSQEISVNDAARIAHCHSRTIYRKLNKVRNCLNATA